MEKKTLFLIILCLLLGGTQTNVFAQYNPIPILRNPPVDKPNDLGAGNALQFSAWYSEDSIKIEVNNYLGNVEVHIYNENDVEVISYYNSIFWFGQCLIDIRSLIAGFYRLEIITDNENYIGEFEVF